MSESSVEIALAMAISLSAEISKLGGITILERLLQKKSKKAQEIKQKLHDTLIQIQIAPDSDRADGIPIKAVSLKLLKEYQPIFASHLKKLGSRANVVEL